uniref:Uncharacterized protein n=1 Tax=uncultured marine virus TaxID=186617 RepID=A0A0F7L6I5_9VIRU|nr:hypothetical protein [uncultured marine virus]
MTRTDTPAPSTWAPRRVATRTSSAGLTLGPWSPSSARWSSRKPPSSSRTATTRTTMA